MIQLCSRKVLGQTLSFHHHILLLSDSIISLGMVSLTWKEVLRKSMKQPWGRQRAILLYFLHTMDLQVEQALSVL